MLAELFLRGAVLICLSSCSFNVEFNQVPHNPATLSTMTVGKPLEPLDGGNVPDDIEQRSVPFIQPTPDPKPQAVKPISHNLPPPTATKTTVKKLCDEFVAPKFTNIPKVDLDALRNVPETDHAAAKNILVSNIRDVYAHANDMEEKIKQAYAKHLQSCVNREIVTK